MAAEQNTCRLRTSTLHTLPRERCPRDIPTIWEIRVRCLLSAPIESLIDFQALTGTVSTLVQSSWGTVHKKEEFSATTNLTLLSLVDASADVISTATALETVTCVLLLHATCNRQPSRSLLVAMGCDVWLYIQRSEITPS